jgi:hypothetical protein
MRSKCYIILLRLEVAVPLLMISLSGVIDAKEGKKNEVIQ